MIQNKSYYLGVIVGLFVAVLGYVFSQSTETGVYTIWIYMIILLGGKFFDDWLVEKSS